MKIGTVINGKDPPLLAQALCGGTDKVELWVGWELCIRVAVSCTPRPAKPDGSQTSSGV
ncbi:MAG: hypothetical protein R3C56_17745 [Pirellulaceae bacterium]